MSSLELATAVVLRAYEFELEYRRSAADQDSRWTLLLGLSERESRGEVKVGSLLNWLLGAFHCRCPPGLHLRPTWV